MSSPIETWDQIINANLNEQAKSCLSALLLSTKNWLASNDKLVLLNLNAHEIAVQILKNTIAQVNTRYQAELAGKSAYEKEEIIRVMFNDAFEQIKKIDAMGSTISINLSRSAEDEVDALLAYVPVPAEATHTRSKLDLESTLDKADKTQSAVSSAGGLISASVQETADFSARASHVSGQTLVALRDPLPPSIASGAHIASVVASGLNLVVFPIILLVAYLRGEDVSLSKEDVGRLGKSVVTLGLGIAGLIVAPTIVIPLLIASAVFAAGTTLIGLGNFLWNRHKENKTIAEKRTALIELTNEIKTMQTEAINDFNAGKITPDEKHVLYAEKIAEQTKQTQALKALIKKREQTGTLREVIPRSLGFMIGAAVIVGVVLLIVPPLAPIGIAIIIGAASAGVALVGTMVASHFMLGRKAKEKAKQNTAAQVEKQHLEKKTHETTADLAKRLGITTDNLSHDARVKNITHRLEDIIKEIKDAETPESRKKGDAALIKFFVTYCEVHQEDSRSALRARPIFNEVAESTRNTAFSYLKVIVNEEKNVNVITPEALKTMQTFDETHAFFTEHGVGVFDVKLTTEPKAAAKPNPKPKPENHPNKLERH